MYRTLCFPLLLFAPAVIAAHALILVSLGMPDATLKALFRQAHRAQVPVFIRGLYTAPGDRQAPAMGSFRDTAARVRTLLGPHGGVLINPLPFRAFHIRAVPALVIADDAGCTTSGARCAKNRFDVLSGNVPLKTAARIIARRSTDAARAALARRIVARFLPDEVQP